MEEIINHWAESLSERLIEIRYVDIEEMKSAMKGHLKSALWDCLKSQLPDLYEKRGKLIEEYQSLAGTPGSGRYGMKIHKINQQIKQYNKSVHKLEDEQKSIEMRNWMKEKHPESLQSFYAHWKSLGYEHRK